MTPASIPLRCSQRTTKFLRVASSRVGVNTSSSPIPFLQHPKYIRVLRLLNIRRPSPFLRLCMCVTSTRGGNAVLVPDSRRPRPIDHHVHALSSQGGIRLHTCINGAYTTLLSPRTCRQVNRPCSTRTWLPGGAERGRARLSLGVQVQATSNDRGFSREIQKTQGQSQEIPQGRSAEGERQRARFERAAPLPRQAEIDRDPKLESCGGHAAEGNKVCLGVPAEMRRKMRQQRQFASRKYTSSRGAGVADHEASSGDHVACYGPGLEQVGSNRRRGQASQPCSFRLRNQMDVISSRQARRRAKYATSALAT